MGMNLTCSEAAGASLEEKEKYSRSVAGPCDSTEVLLAYFHKAQVLFLSCQVR